MLASCNSTTNCGTMCVIGGGVPLNTSQKVTPTLENSLQLFNHNLYCDRNNIIGSGIYLRIVWYHICRNRFNISEVMPTWLSAPPELKVAVLTLCAVAIKLCTVDTHIGMSWLTYRFFKTWFKSGLIGRVKALQSRGNL